MSLTDKEICAIIRQCEKSGVAEFKHNEFSLVFRSKPIERENFPAQTKEAEAIPVKLENQVELRENPVDPILATAQDDLAELMISDPVAYEEAQARREVLNGKEDDRAAQ